MPRKRAAARRTCPGGSVVPVGQAQQERGQALARFVVLLWNPCLARQRLGNAVPAAAAAAPAAAAAVAA